MGPLSTLRARLRSDGLALLPAAPLLAVVLAWAATGGGYEPQPALDAGYDPGAWYLGGLVLVGVLLATLIGLGSVRLSTPLALACLALAGYVGWSYLSVLWAHDQGVAFLGSNRALVYLAAFLTFAILPWRSWSARVALAALAAGIGVLGIVVAVKVATLTDPSGLYIDRRLAYPLGYYNADAALFMTGAALAIALSALRDVPSMLRVAGIALAAVCLQLAVLSQSRGWLFTVPIVLALMLLLVPKRLRLLAFALGPVAATAAVTPALLRVYARATPHGVALTQPRLSAVLHEQGAHAARAMLVADLVLGAVAALAVAADRRARIGRTALRSANRLAAAMAGAAALAGVAIGLAATHGDPIGRAERAWHSFADSHSTTSGYSHFASLGNHRVDIWRVALHDFASQPFIGIGQDNFAASYARLRHSDEQPRWVHSLELRLLAHTGLVGALLFAAFLACVLLAALRGRPRDGPERTAAGLLLIPLAVWLVQGSIDWFWEYPVLSVPALAFAGAAAALGRPHGRAARTRLPAIAGRVLAALLGGAALAALIVSFVAARETQKATEIWSSQPAQAYKNLRAASGLLPFDAQIYLVGGAIALNSEEPARARRWLTEAERHEDQGWVAPFLLGMLDGEQGRRSSARAELARASELNPTEPLIGQALDRVSTGHPLTFAEAQLLLSPHIVTPHA